MADDYTFEDYFTEFTYSNLYKSDISEWYSGKKFDSNIIEIDFASDNLAHFYGFKLSWRVWSINPCMTKRNKCHSSATCSETNVRGGFKCTCDDGFVGDGLQCSPRDKLNTATVCKLQLESKYRFNI